VKHVVRNSKISSLLQDVLPSYYLAYSLPMPITLRYYFLIRECSSYTGYHVPVVWLKIYDLLYEKY